VFLVGFFLGPDPTDRLLKMDPTRTPTRTRLLTTMKSRPGRLLKVDPVDFYGRLLNVDPVDI
jgi:hypothetical protein